MTKPVDETPCVQVLQAKFEAFLIRYGENRESDRKLTDLDKELRNKALDLAKGQADLNFEHLNNLRKDVVEDRTKFVSVDVFNARLGEENGRLRQLERFVWMSLGAVALLSAVLRFVR